MATASSTLRGVARFTYGTEFESLAKPKQIIYDVLEKMGFDHTIQPGSGNANADDIELNRQILMKLMTDVCTDVGVPTDSTDSNGYKRLNIKREPVLDDVGGFYAMEFVSQVFSTNQPGCCETLEVIYRVLEKHCDLLRTKGTSQHVHVKPKPAPNAEEPTIAEWTLSQLRSLLRAAAVFDKAITKIMPADRKNNTWAKSSSYDIELEKAIKVTNATDNGTGGSGSQTTPSSKLHPNAQTLVRLFGEVPTNIWDGLFNYIENRQVSWNFMALTLKSKTIEFRRPPGAQTAKDAQKWVTFAVAFASASLEQGWEDQWRSRKEHATVSELQAFINWDLMRLDHDWQNALIPEESFVEILAEAEPESN